MALRMPVVQIPLDDRDFQKFAEAFGEYDKKLGEMPGKWKHVSKEFRGATAAVLAQNHMLRGHGLSDPAKMRQVETGWKNIAGWSNTVLSNAMRVTGQLLKWGTILGGGLLGGSLFGIDRMAGGVSASRFNYLGLGMGYGSWRSFGLNMSRFVDPGSFLSSINQAVSNPGLQGPLYAMGVNPNGSTEQVGLSMLRAMRQLALKTPRGELGLMSQAYGLEPYGGLETLMRLKSMSASEFYKQLQHEKQDKNSLGLPRDVARKWQDFTTQMERAKSTIVKTFITGLAPLEQPLERLSVAFSGFITKVMTGPEIKKGIDALAKWLDTFSAPKFLTSMDHFAADIEKVVAVLDRWVGNPTNPGATNHVGGVGDWWRRQKEFIQTGLDPTAFNSGNGNRGDLKQWLSFLDKQYKLPAGTMERVAKTESGFNANALNAKTGAAGMFQFTPGTAATLGVTDPYDVVQEGRAAAQYLSKLQAQFGSMAAAHAVYGGYGDEMRSLMSKYGKGWQAHMPRAMRNYVTATTPDSGIVVTARHKSGANAVLAAAGLAGVPQ